MTGEWCEHSAGRRTNNTVVIVPQKERHNNMKAYMNDVSVEDAIKAGRTDTLCWDCKKAMRGGVLLV